ncbi:hypothetical protein H6P81_002197 [Aristolochia fimbriata]|uniref:Serine aminopeptidase S33 domain-containing protein n=1 Tax=Aristolochia fimbriata TaxID=158543 RepID=A0AAV7FAV7_ARIFI|nr:hypothetical protein H6P81_002197 [Aristolochia fimbriata]
MAVVLPPPERRFFRFHGRDSGHSNLAKALQGSSYPVAFDLSTSISAFPRTIRMISVGSSLPTSGIRLSVAPHKTIEREREKKLCIGGTSSENQSQQKISGQMEAVPKVSSASSSLILTAGASGRVTALFTLQALRSLLVLVNSFLLLLLFPFQLRKRSIAVEKPKEEKRELSSHRKSGGSVMRVPAAMLQRRNSTPVCSAVVSDDQQGPTRRALAIKRVEQDIDDNSIREFLFFLTARGDTLFTQSWTPVSVKVRGLVILLHGLNEHSGRYSNFAKKLNANGYKVYGMDWMGHGGSDGLHAYVHSLDEAVDDMKQFLEKVLAENPGLPCFLFGHSTGGAIIVKAVLDSKVKCSVDGMVLTSPAIRVQPSHPIFSILAPVFSFFLPKFQFSAANKAGGLPVSRDPEALVAKYSDPLVFTGSIRVRTGYEILRLSTYLQQNLVNITTPFLVMHGTADTVTDPEASEKLYEEASSTDKSIKLYEGFVHDLLFEPEPEREAVMQDIIDWLNSRLKI